MALRIGTSGYSYKEWKGTFYPADCRPGDMLSYYAQKLGTVEINNTFYRMPTRKVLDAWAAQVPDGFRFVLKLSQKVTHYKRLKAVEDEMGFIMENARGLGEKLGALLVQIPPNFARDDERLSAFLAMVPSGIRIAFEVRHASWLDAGVYALLEKHGAALVASQTDEEPEPPIVRTAPWGYLRLRKSTYTDQELTAWSERIAGIGWDEAYIFFKHEQIAPALAGAFAQASAGTR